jgi:hypothetical protein
MRRNLLVPFFAIAMMTCMYLPIKTQPVKAQKTSAKNKIARQNWEYCAIVSSSYSSTEGIVDGGVATILYFETSGYREEIVKLQGEKIDKQIVDKYEYMEQKARAVAIAQLGNQGWEMIGQLPFTYRFDIAPSNALFFKRVKI